MSHPGPQAARELSPLRRVGLNVLYLVPGEVGGSEIYARELIGALARARPRLELLVFANEQGAPSFADARWPENVSVVRLRVQGSNKPGRVLTELVLLPRVTRRHRVELLHSLGTTGPLSVGLPHVLSVLDLIYARYPSTFSPLARLGLHGVVGPAARRADRVVAISHAVGRDVVGQLGVSPQRVDVVSLGRGAAQQDVTPEQALAVRRRLQIGDGRVVLCVSAALAHKNLSRLIEAFAELGPGYEDCRLVLVGHRGREAEGLREQASRAGVASRVLQTGWIEREELEGLYRLARCCVYPSLHEGFGMPALEAMARGVPLACSNADALGEVAGEAAELFDPRDVREMRCAIARLLDDRQRRDQLIELGRQRAACFTWERCAEGVLASWERARHAHHSPANGGQRRWVAWYGR